MIVYTLQAHSLISHIIVYKEYDNKVHYNVFFKSVLSSGFGFFSEPLYFT